MEPITLLALWCVALSAATPAAGAEQSEPELAVQA
jgi:hypothetical protein